MRFTVQNFDTIIIGAGAAGLAAGRKLADAGQSILIVEARDRIGGRIWTDEQFADFPIDLGAEFIHGETAVTHTLVEAAGFHTLAAPRKAYLQIAAEGTLRALAQLPAELATTVQALYAAYAELAQLTWRHDLSLADFLRGRGFHADAIALADVLLAQTCCASIETLSCADLAREMRVDHAGVHEYRILEGYTALLRHYSRDLPILLKAPVELLRWSERGVELVANGQSLHAARCIITLPIGVLQSGRLRFDPPLPPAKAQAISAFRMEPGTKLMYRFQEQLWDDMFVYACHTGLAARWWTPGYGRHGANHLLCCYVTASRARQIDAMPEAAALALGLTEIAALMGQPKLADACVAAKRVSWAHEPFTRGAYAHTPPGAADARVELAQPVANVLFFAGEATAHETNPQTVHGAIESGWRAAREVCAIA